MQQNIKLLKQTKLFSGMNDEDTLAMLNCMQANMVSYKKGEYVYRQGEHIDNIAILVKGKLLIQRDDFWGNRTIINPISPGEIFGEAYAAPESGSLLNDVVADTDCDVIFINIRKMLTVCSNSCRFHSMVIQNLFYAISEKNRYLVQKLVHTSKRSTRAKLISYLSDEAKKNNSNSFTIPFNRQQLADFLSVDRSAMSNELCKMRDEGMLEFNRSHFTLLQGDGEM